MVLAVCAHTIHGAELSKHFLCQTGTTLFETSNWKIVYVSEAQNGSRDHDTVDKIGACSPTGVHPTCSEGAQGDGRFPGDNPTVVDFLIISK